MSQKVSAIQLTTCSTEVVAASEPGRPVPPKTPIFLVREDGQCILPTNLVYP